MARIKKTPARSESKGSPITGEEYNRILMGVELKSIYLNSCWCLVENRLKFIECFEQEEPNVKTDAAYRALNSKEPFSIRVSQYLSIRVGEDNDDVPPVIGAEFALDYQSEEPWTDAFLKCLRSVHFFCRLCHISASLSSK
jgi:hypothetical protein